MSDSEDDGEDITLRDGASDIGGPDMTEDCFLWNDYDTANNQKKLEGETDFPPAVTRVASEDIEAQTLSGRTTVINTAVSDVGRETTSSGAGHTGGELDDDEIEGIERLQTAFEELKTHITKA